MNYSRPHRLQIVLGSMLAQGQSGPWSGRWRAMLDGAAVLEGRGQLYPTTADEIQVGRNFIGGNSCGRAFSGRILELVRDAP